MEDESPNYAINLANVFNLHCEQIYKSLLSTVSVSDEHIFGDIQKCKNPLLEELLAQFKQFSSNYFGKSTLNAWSFAGGEKYASQPPKDLAFTKTS